MSTKITFWRESFATNSSSEHALAFVSNIEDWVTDTTKDFGWGHFTAASREAKLKYMMLCLYSSWSRLTEISTYKSIIDSKAIEAFLLGQFKVWVKENVPILKDHIDEFSNDYDYGHVDHQSMMTFPCHRLPERDYLNAEFAQAFIQELVENNYVILGGNDNEDSDHPDIGLNEPEMNHLAAIYHAMTEKDPKTLLCEHDHKTGEWVCSDKHNGRLFKFILTPSTENS